MSEHSNEQCADDMRDAWQEGFADAIAALPPVTAILQDLIAELVGMADQGLDSGWAPLYEVADRAEARLKEVTGDE